MKRHVKLILLLLLVGLAAGALIGAAVVFAGERNAADGDPQLTPTVQTGSALAEGESGERSVTAKGAVVPVAHATLSMAASGIIAEVLVEEGEVVTAGQVLVRLQDQRQRAVLAEAEGALASAQAQLETLQAGARAEEIAAAEATLDAAKARVQRLQEGGRSGDVAAARASVQAAQAALQRLDDGPDETTRIAAAADFANAEASLRSAQAAYDKVKDRNDVGMLPQSLQLEQATNAYAAAKARYDEVMAPPKQDRVAQAAAQVKTAQAELDRVVDPATAAELAEAEAMVRQAQAQVDLLKAGAREQELKAAEASVAQAEAGRQQALAAVADAELRAPFGGMLAVLHVRTGEQVVAGTPVAELGDVSDWWVETDDLSELDIVRVQPGQTVELTFDAIPGLTLRGTVERVQPKGEKKLGDMTYTALVRVEEADPRLLWNMTAVVNLP